MRVGLHNRRVTGWVSALDPADEPVAAARLQPIIEVVSRGPAPDLFDLAAWAAVRWAAGRLRPFLVAASPHRRIRQVPPRRRGDDRSSAAVSLGPVGRQAAELLDAGGGVLVIPPATSPVEAIAAAAARGPTLVIVPAVARAEAMAAALRRRRFSVAMLPEEWPAAAAGTDIVIGTRAAAWGPCPDLVAAVVVDEHDESLQEERTPTWHARDVLAERARRAGAAVLLTSPCPTLSGLAAVAGAGGTVGPPVRLPGTVERAGWPVVDVVDRTEQEPWRTSLVSSELIGHLRRGDATVVCVHNTPGRGRVLACRTCHALVRCERCDAAVAIADPDDSHDDSDGDGGDEDGAPRLACLRCGSERAAVCQECGGARFANLRPGVTRLREELEAAAGRPVAAVTARGAEPDRSVGVFVGTEAVLHRIHRADVVAFLDIDRELLAPRYRAAEQAIALVARAARLVGPRDRGGRVILQTYLPDHDVVRAAQRGDPARLLAAATEDRDALQLPPAMALAEISGPGSDELAAELRRAAGVAVGGAGERYLVRTAGWHALGAALIAAKAATGSRARIAVDPPRV